MKGVFITATDTNAGKTWVGKHLIKALLRHGEDVVVRKPVESGWPNDTTQTDAWILANAGAQEDRLSEVCTNRFKAHVSPDRAALLEKTPVTIETVKQQTIKNVEKNQFLFVEGAGGFYSPLCSNGLNADLAISLNLPMVLIVENRLGCINHALLTVEAIAKHRLNLLALVLNNPLENNSENEGMDNFSDIKKQVDCPIISVNHAQRSDNPFEKLYSLIAHQ